MRMIAAGSFFLAANTSAILEAVANNVPGPSRRDFSKGPDRFSTQPNEATRCRKLKRIQLFVSKEGIATLTSGDENRNMLATKRKVSPDTFT